MNNFKIDKQQIIVGLKVMAIAALVAIIGNIIVFTYENDIISFLVCASICIFIFITCISLYLFINHINELNNS